MPAYPPDQGDEGNEMPSRRILVQHREITEELPAARQILKNSDLILTFNTIDRGDYGFTITGLQLMKNLEVVLSVFMETAKQLRNLIVESRGAGLAGIDNLSGDDIRFINMFSLFASAAEAITSCEALRAKQATLPTPIVKNKEGYKVKLKVREDVTFRVKEIKNFISNATGSIPKNLIKDYRDYVQFYRDKGRLKDIADVLNCTIRYFTVMRNTLEKIARDSHYDLYREALEGTYVNILGKVFDGFHYSAEDYSENSSLMDVSVDEIIGNQKYLKAALKLARDVAGFDFATWQNPKQVNPILFALGNPGCGKTITAHAVGNYFLDFCKKHGIRSRFVIIRRTDWASSYQNASARQLIDIFKRNILEYRGVVGVYWPDIDTAFAARGDSSLRNEEKNILGAVFGLFDGTILPKNGQWFMLTDANFMNMDKATISRITQDPYYVKGPENPSDFVALFRDVKLRKHKEFLNLNDEEWEKFGNLCIENKLSGRSIDNMSRKAIAMIEDFEFPDEYFKSDIEKKRKIIKEYSKTLDYEDIREITLNYVQFEKEAEEKSYRKRFEDRVKEISTYLSAEKIARASLLGAD